MSGPAFSVLTLALAWAIATPALAAAVDPVTGRGTAPLIERRWLVDDGLPNNVINQIAQDARGFLWIATLSGLARFDGVEIKVVPLPAEYVTRGHNIRGLAVEDGTTIVVLTADSRVIRYRDGQYTPHPVDASTRAFDLLELAIDGSGALWLATGEPSVLRWGDGMLATFTEHSGQLRKSAPLRFATDSRGRAWVAGGEFLAGYDDGRLRRPEVSPGESLSIAPARSGGLWVASRRSLSRLDGDVVTPVLTGSAWPAAAVGIEQMLETGDGTLWIGTRRQGAWRLAGERLEPVSASNDLINCIHEDLEGNVWLGTGGSGLFRLRPRHHVILNAQAQLPEDVSSGVCEDDDGAIWCANRGGGAVRVFGGEVTSAFRTTRRSPPFINIIAPDASGRIWFGGPSGLYSSTQETVEAEPFVQPRFTTVRILHRAANDDLWVTADDPFLGYLRGTEYHPITAAPSVVKDRISGIASDSLGRTWVGTEPGGLFEIDGQTITPVGDFGPHRPARIHALAVDSRDNLWLGGIDGLYLRVSGKFFRFSSQHGLPDEIIHQFIEDDYGRLWVGTRRGVFYARLDEFYEIAAGKRERLEARLFGRQEGLSGTSTVLGGQPTAWKSHDGRIWLCTHRGIVGFEANTHAAPVSPPSVYLDAIQVDGRELTIGEDNTLQVVPGSQRAVFRFTAPSFASPESVRIRYRLDGFDSGWTEAGADRAAEYTNLPAGRYRLQAQASNQAGQWRGSVATVAMVVMPVWWQTWWWRSLVVAVAIGIALGCGRVWSHRILRRRLERLERQHELERERARIARDLHDDLGGSLTLIGLAAERLMRSAPPGVASAGLEQLARQSRQLAGDLDSIIWTVNPRHGSWEQLAGFLAQTARRFFAGTCVAVAIDGVESFPDAPITPDTQHHLIAITKEALNNTLKHAVAHRVQLTFARPDETSITLDIHDDGRGFDTADPEIAERNGLANIRSRCAEIGAELTLETRPGGGTRITLRVPLCRRRIDAPRS